MKRCYCCLFLCTTIIFSCTKADAGFNDQEIIDNLTPSEEENKLFKLVNEYRKSLNLNDFIFDEISYSLASAHSDYMVSKGHTSHAKFNERAAQITTKTGAELVAENVANDYLTIEEAMISWVNSAGHKENIEGDFTHSAISIKVDMNQNLYFTQIFYR